MQCGVPEVCDVIANEVVRLVEVYRKRILKSVVNRASEAYDSVLPRLDREVVTVSRELPYGLDYRKEVLENAFSCCRIL